MGRSIKANLLLGFKIFLSGVLLVIIVLKVNWNDFAIPDRRADLVQIGLGMFCGVGFNLVKFLKWQKLIRTENTFHSYWDASKSYMIGNSLGLVTPMRVGDLGRALYFDKSDRPRIMALTVVDRVIDLSVVLILSIGGVFYLVSKSLALVVGLLAAATILFLYSNKYLCISIKRALPEGGYWDKVRKLVDILRTVSSGTMSTAMILSLLAFSTVIIQFYYLVSAFESASFGSMCLVTPLITLSSIMPVTFMGLGVREGISIILFSTFGISGAVAATSAFLVFIMNNVIIGLLGIVFVWKSI